MASEREKQYLDEVCSHVKWRQAHGNIRTELSQHMEELREAKLSEGMSEEQASAETVLEMGDSELVGVSMNQAYRPRISVHALGMLAVLVALGIIVNVLLGDFKINAIAGTVIGAGIFLGMIYFLDMRWIMEKAGQIVLYYALAGFAMAVYLFLIGDGYHYIRMLYLERFILCWTLFQPVMVVLHLRSMRGKKLSGLITTGVYCVLTWLPVLILPNVAAAFFIGLVDLVLICLAIAKREFGGNRWIQYGVVAVALCLIVFVFLRVSSGYHIGRLKATFAMRSYEHSYQQLRTQTFFKYSKFIGAVEFSSYFSYTNDVISEYDYLLLKLAMRWGTWVFLAAGLVMTGVLTVLIAWCVRQKGIFVKLLCGAVIGIFFVQVLEYFLVNVGALDWATISLPFLTQGNFLLITNFALMGILFSAAGSGWLYEDGQENNKKSKVAV